MKLKAFTLRFDEDTGRFDTRDFDEFVDKNNCIAVYEHFFVHEGLPRWAILVTRREDHVNTTTVEGRQARQDWRSELTDEDRGVYDALRHWRNERARREGRPPYVLLTNRQMAAVASGRPTTIAALRDIDGIGEARATAYGEEALAVVVASRSAPTGQREPDPMDARDTELEET